MRYWLSFRGPYGTRPGISASGRELTAWRRKPAPTTSDGMLGIFRKADGSIYIGLYGKNAEHEKEPGLEAVAAYSFGNAEAAQEARTGAQVRMARHMAQDGLLTGLSVGQVVSAIRSEAAALGLDASFVRVHVAKPGDHTESGAARGVPRWVAALLALAIIIVLAATAHAAPVKDSDSDTGDDSAWREMWERHHCPAYRDCALVRKGCPCGEEEGEGAEKGKD